MRVALIHDHLAQDGGAEKVLKSLVELYPQADIFTLLYEPKNVDKLFAGRQIKTSVIQRLPGGVKHYQWYMPFMPIAVEFFNLKNYDLVISDASAFAKGVITSVDTVHICYCHTPTRYLWDYAQQYIEELKYNKFIKKIISLVLNYIRLWDKSAADRVDVFIANSLTVQRRIAKYYRRQSTVVYPPVEVDRFDNNLPPGDYYLAGGRLAPYKRLDLVVSAFKELGWQLKIFGDGVDLKRLKKIAANATNIHFLGRVSDAELPNLYAGCQAFINPQEEDFGITAVEAMASGRPVIAYGKGGATETVIEGVTGVFFNSQDVQSLIEAIKKSREIIFDPQEIKRQAQKYRPENFKIAIKEIVEQSLNKNLLGDNFL